MKDLSGDDDSIEAILASPKPNWCSIFSAHHSTKQTSDTFSWSNSRVHLLADDSKVQRETERLGGGDLKKDLHKKT
jgi:hypothetical protein